jgi:hypothetical protein
MVMCMCWSASSPHHVTWPYMEGAAPINTICVQLLHQYVCDASGAEDVNLKGKEDLRTT